MAKVLVTGVAGFTGRYVSRALASRGHDVIGMIHEVPDMRFDVPVDLHTCDLADITGLEKLVRDTRPDRVVHLAAISFVSHADVNEIYQANTIGTLNLLQVLARADHPVEQVLLASSANVYGNRQDGQLTEDVEPLPSNHYGVSKLAMEHVARIMGGQVPITITRPFNYTGVGQSPNFVIPKLVDHARRRQASIELGNLAPARDFSDVRMVADCYARLLEAPAAIGHTFNVCSGRSYALREVIRIVEDLADIKFDISENPAFVRSDEIMELYGSRSRLDDVVGEVPMPDLRETLSWMLGS